MGFILRWLFAFVLLAATFNPTPYNFVRWADANWRDQLPLAVLLGLLLFAAYAIYLRATLRSIGPFGMVLVAALAGAIVWVLIDWGVLSLANPTLNTWLGLLVLSVVLGIGLSWSIVRRRLSGQADVDDVDEN
jgi:drug/metabolite transporter (DMT)-like permease